MEGLEMKSDSQFWSGRRVLVTGATGIVGSWLIKALLERRAAIVALVRDADPQSELIRSGDYARVSVVNGQLEDFWTLERAINEYEVETVFHLGAQPIVGMANRFPLQTFETNIRGTYNLLEACRIHRDFVGRVVIASSDKAYGQQSELPYHEGMPLQGRHPYDVSKSCTDMLAQAYFHTFDLPVAIARCGNTYGGGDLNWSRIVPGTIRSLQQQERPVIRSDGSFVRDYIYVKDVVNGYISLAERLNEGSVRGESFNFSHEAPLTVMAIAETIRGLMGCEEIDFDIRNDARHEIHSQYLSSDKAKKTLEWVPAFDLETGLRETIDWYLSYLTRIGQH